jgi:alpha-beta hydrolase superfamily lysophospholipase
MAQAARRSTLDGMLALLAALLPIAAAVAAEPVVLTAADGGRVFGRYVPAADAHAPLILLFHQARASKEEYRPIQLRLAAEGYASLAIDQRAGGGYFGGRNETVAARGGVDASYDDALSDLEAALAWARAKGPSRPVILWGSSYSAALVFLLAARHPGEVAAVLAFSPGEYLGRKGAVAAAARGVRVPVFVTSTASADEERAADEILAAAPATLKIQLRPAGDAAHGSATLRDDSNPRGAPAIWQGVLAFLHEAVPS